ncbi:MAG: hypothetical protein AB1657_02865 [Candidatus Micrarchaeota archaeon]
MESGRTGRMSLQDMRSAVSAALAAPPRKPLLSDPETIIGRPNPRIWLACALGATIGSNLLAWQIAKNTCSVFRPQDSGRCPEEHEVLALRPAIKLVLSALRSSPQDALQVSRAIAALSGCRKDHLAQFLDFLAPVAEAKPEFAFMLMCNFSANPQDSRLLGLYHEAISLAFGKGGEDAASTLSAVFSEVGRFSETARMFLESYLFSVRSMGMADVEGFTQQFCGDWKKALKSEAFTKNPD